MSALFLKYMFVVLNVSAAAAWFGLAMRVSSQARLVLKLERAAAVALAERTGKTVRTMGVILILTFAFGVAAFLLGEGFGAYAAAFHTSIGLIVLLILDQYLVINRAWEKVDRGISGGQTVEAGLAAGARKRMAAGIGIGHVLWIVMLGLVVWNSLAAGH